MIITNAEKCTGCALCSTVCAQEAIFMKRNKAGFPYPSIDTAKCIDCGACQKICPQNTDDAANPDSKAFYGYALDTATRLGSTSGGIFPVLCHIFRNDVIVGAAMDGASCNHIVIDMQKDPHQVTQLFGSKYVQSTLSPHVYAEMKAHLQDGRRVLFSGVPCQCAAVIKKFKNAKFYKNLYVCEVMCHGVPSPLLFEKWYEHLSQKKPIAQYHFRSKAFGWLELGCSITYANNKQKAQPCSANAYHTYFGNHWSLRQSCFHCKYRNHARHSDLTIGDFWAAKQLKDWFSKRDLQQGISAILTNSEKGNYLLTQLTDQCCLKEIERDQAYLYNLPSIQNFPIPPQWDEFMNDIALLPMDKILKKYPNEPAIKSRLRVLYHKLRGI